MNDRRRKPQRSISELESLQTLESGADAASFSLKQYRRIVLLTDGFATPFLAKTAISMLRYRCDDIVAVLEPGAAGQTAQQLFGVGADVPVIASLEEIEADAVFIGIAPPGGDLPSPWRDTIKEALRRGIDVVSGLHDFLSNNADLAALAAENDCRLIDVRKNTFRQIASRVDFRPGCLRIHTVGQDCSLGKMVTTLELERDLRIRGLDAKFLASGQTGIMISGDGIPIDCVVADFVNGAAECLVETNQDHDILLIEGQGSLSHPCYSAVTTGLLHGCAPDGLILCYEVGRETVKGLDNVPLLPLKTLVEAYEQVASLRHPCRVIGVAMNSRNVSAEEASQERERVSRELGLPVCDVIRDGPGALVDAVLKLKQELA